MSSKGKTKQREIERFLMKVAETAENAMREYMQDREAENRLYATEYVTRRGLSHSSNTGNAGTGEAARLCACRGYGTQGKRALRHGNVHNSLFRHGKRHSQPVEK